MSTISASLRSLSDNSKKRAGRQMWARPGRRFLARDMGRARQARGVVCAW